MFRKCCPLKNWIGGQASIAALGKDLRPADSMHINVRRDVIAGTLPPEARLLPPVQHTFSKWNRSLRPEIYQELLKLPLRFSVHSFETLHNHCSASEVGYAPPLGPADPLDTLPFFVHRNANGRLPGKVYSYDNKKQLPEFFLSITHIEGDLFRFEEELIKIFPTKKTFVRNYKVIVCNADKDGLVVLHHWLLGLGF